MVSHAFPLAVIVARLLTQALSNLVTSHDALVDRLWATYMSLPEDEGVIMYGLLFSNNLLLTLFLVVSCNLQTKKHC